MQTFRTHRRSLDGTLSQNFREKRAGAFRCQRLIFNLGCLALATSLFLPAATAQPQNDKEKRKVVEDKAVMAADGWPITLTYYKSPAGKESPVVILLHQKQSNRLVWRVFADRLQSMGYAVVAVDLRKHGQSRGAVANTTSDVAPTKGSKGADIADLNRVDYEKMALLDLEAVKKFLMEEHQNGNLNIRKMGIVAAEMSAPIALRFTSNDWAKRPYPDAATVEASTPRGQDVRALVLISPEENVQGLNTNIDLRGLSAPAFNIAVMICVGSQDSLDRGKAKRMHQKLMGNPRNKDRMILKTYNNVKLRGTALLGKRLLVEENMIAFFELSLKKLPDEWRDRKSRLEK